MAASTASPDLQIADMYERWTLDCVVELAQAIAVDFVGRPRQYKDVPQAIATTLQNLWYLPDTDPQFPGAAKRQMVFTPMLGLSDVKPGSHDSQFHAASAALREAARAFTERQVDTGEDSLRRAFQDAVVTLRSYLVALTANAVVTSGNSQTGHVFEQAVSVLSTSEVTAVFGLTPSDQSCWPLSGSFDDNGARVIEEVSKTLQTRVGLISQSGFIVMQRIAAFGSNTLRGVLQHKSSGKAGDLDNLIQEAYRWKTAIDALDAESTGSAAVT